MDSKTLYELEVEFDGRLDPYVIRAIGADHGDYRSAKETLMTLSHSNDKTESSESIPSTASNTPDSDLAFLCSSFPGFSVEKLSSIWSNSGGDIKISVDILLNELSLQEEEGQEGESEALVKVDSSSGTDVWETKKRKNRRKKNKKPSRVAFAFNDMQRQKSKDSHSSTLTDLDESTANNTWNDISNLAKRLATLLKIPSTMVLSILHKPERLSALENLVTKLGNDRDLSISNAAFEKRLTHLLQKYPQSTEKALATWLRAVCGDYDGVCSLKETLTIVESMDMQSNISKRSHIHDAGKLPDATDARKDKGSVSMQRRATPIPAQSPDLMFMADDFRRRRDEAYQQAARHFRGRNSQNREGAVAQFWAQHAREMQAKSEEVALDAARAVVYERAPDGRTVDLHSLTKTQAMQITSEFLDEWSMWTRSPLQEDMAKASRQGLRIITGSGVHSTGHKAQILPAIERMLHDGGWKWRRENTGSILVHMRSSQ